MNYAVKDLENISIKKDLLNGYNVLMVENILAKVREDYALFKKELDDLKNNLIVMTEKVQHYKTIEESLQHTLIIAQHTSENIKNNALEKANNIIREAEVAAQKLLNDASQQVAKIRQEYDEAKNNLTAYKTKSSSVLLSLVEYFKQVE